MEKRGLISLRGVLLRYLVQTVFCCVLALLLWFAALMCVINSGLALPANQAAQACQKAAQDVLPGMTAATFDETQLDSLCRYALFAAPDSSEVLATNMDAGHLQRAMENRQGKNRWHFGYTQYYMTSKLQDGTVCLLQFDYAVPYAAPALRGKLPDVQTVHCILGILLLVGAVVWSTTAPESFWPGRRPARPRSPGRWLRKRAWKRSIFPGRRCGNTPRHWLPCRPWGRS